MIWFQTDGSVPNTLVIANCEVVKPRVAAAEHISQVSYCFVALITVLFCWKQKCMSFQPFVLWHVPDL